MESAITYIGEHGELVVPARLTAALALAPGAAVLLRVENGALHVEPRNQAVADVQRAVAQYLAPGESLVDEQIAQRTTETGRDRP